MSQQELAKHYKLRCTEAKLSKGAKNFSKDNEYYTPKYIVDRFGKFDYDPATTEDKAKELEIQNFDTKGSDGLKTDWTKYKRIWCNPPFTLKKEFLLKAQEYYDITGGYICILLPIEFLTTKLFHTIIKGAKIYLPNGRIKFESGLGKDSCSPAFGSVILKLDNNWSIEEFELK